MLASLASARRSIWITQLAFDPDCVAHAREPSAQPPPSIGPGTVLAEALLDAAVRAPVDVRVLLNATLLLDTSRSLRRFFAARLAAKTAAHRSEFGFNGIHSLKHIVSVIICHKFISPSSLLGFG